MAPLTLNVHICDQRRSYLAHFATDGAAVGFIEARMSTHAITLDEENTPQVVADAFPRTVDLLYPVCEHGLSLRLCAGPGHYPPDRY